MKRAIFLFCLVAFSQLVYADQSGYIYAIQVAASKRPDMTRFAKLIPLGHLYKIQIESGVQRVRLGTFSGKTEAESVLSKVEAAGFYDAFLVKTLLQDGASIHTVQVMTYNHGDAIGWRKIADQLEHTYVDARDGKIKIFSGEFAAKKQADVHANALKNVGFGDAFVKQINRKLLIAIDPEGNQQDYQESPIIKTEFGDKKEDTESVSDPTSLPIWNSLTPQQQKSVVFLDGALHIKQGNRFIPLEDIQP